MTEPLELLVIEGQKHGARAPVSTSDITSVGNDYDCDVMLGLPGIEHALTSADSDNQPKLPNEYPKVEIKQHEGRLLLRVVRGNIQVGQDVLSEGGHSELSPDTPVTLGNSVFVVGPSTALQVIDKQPGLSDNRDMATSDTTALVAELVQQSGAESAAIKPKQRVVSVMNAVAALCVVVGGIIAFVNYGQSDRRTQVDATKTVSAQLERGGFAGLSVAFLDDNAVLVNGFLESRSQLYEARTLLQSSTNAVIEWDVQLGETLVDSVQSVFQVNGVVATVESVASGSVLVKTSTDDLPLLERIEQVAYADVANLEHLELINTVPAVAAAEPQNKDFASIPGKRIVMSVAGEYILTEDGSVYYTGSVLPSGHKVLAILDNAIQVELNNHQIELTF